MSPDAKLTDPNTGTEQPVALNYLQETLWPWYLQDIDEIVRLADGRPITVVHVGDPTQGVKYPQELVSTSVADHIAIALANLEPWWKHENVVNYRQVVGTGAHEFSEGAASVLIAKHVEKSNPRVNTRVYHHALANIAGADCDLAHHGTGTGVYQWLRGNVLRQYVRSIMLSDIAAGKQPPALVARGHFHEYVRELVPVGDFETWAIILPSWQYPVGHARQAARSPGRVTFGMVAVEMSGGKIVGKPHPFKRTIDHRTQEVIR